MTTRAALLAARVRLCAALRGAGYLSDQKLSGRTWVFIGGTVATSFGTGLALPFLAIYLTAQKNLSGDVVALLYAVLGVVSVLCGPVGGRTVDRISPRFAAITGSILQGVGFAILAVAAGIPTMCVGMVVIGIGNGLFFSARTPVIVDLVEPPARTRAFSMRFLANNVGAGAGVILAGFLLSDSSLPGAALILANGASFLLFATVLAAVAPRTSRSNPVAHPSRESREPLSSVLNGSVVRLIIANTMIAFFGITQIDSTLPLAFHQSLHLDYEAIGMIIGASSFVAVLIQLPIGRLVEVVGSARSFRVQNILWCTAWLFGAIGMLAPAATLPLAVSMLLCICIAECLFNPALNNLIVELSPASHLGRVNGLISSSYSASLTWGPAVGFVLLSSGQVSYWCTLLLGVFIALIFGFRMKPHPFAATDESTPSTAL